MDIQIGKLVHIQPVGEACTRTKECIANYGSDGFIVTGFDPNSWRFGNTPAIRLVSNFKSWSGWLPLLEIDSRD